MDGETGNKNENIKIHVWEKKETYKIKKKVGIKQMKNKIGLISCWFMN